MNKLIALSCWLLLSFPIAAQEEAPALFIENRDFSILSNPQPQLPELILVFWYGSESSYQVYGALADWAVDQPITLWPAIFRESWRPAGKLAIIANNLNLDSGQQLSLFETLLSYDVQWQDKDSFYRLLSPYVDDKEVLDRAIRDTMVFNQLNQIQKSISHYPISGVPTIIFKGKYIVNAQQAGTSVRLIQILDHLIHQELLL